MDPNDAIWAMYSNNNIKKVKKEVGNGQRGRALERDNDFYFLFFILFVSFSDL